MFAPRSLVIQATLVLLVWAGASWAFATDDQQGGTTATTANAVEEAQQNNDPAVPVSESEMVVLLVDKSRLHAKLVTWPGQLQSSRPLRTFKIAIGKEEGDKQIEGDNKTPEGIYFTQRHIPGETLPAKYGPLAIPIDFPNVMDKSAGKTGYGIWLHGVDRAGRIEEAKVTEGCVAFYNQDITKLGSWLKPAQAAVVISNDLQQVNKPQDWQAVKAVAETWQQAWAERNIETYIDQYHPEFRSGARDREAYKEYKKRVFGSYKRMSVKFSNLRVLTHDKYAVAMMNQDFNGDDRFLSVGRKVLFLVTDKKGDWLIKREVFDNQEFVFPSFTDAEIALLSGSAEAGNSSASQN